MSWFHVLPNGLFERGMRVFIIIVLSIASGFGMGLWVTRDNFKSGCEFTQRAYTTPGYVTREVIKK